MSNYQQPKDTIIGNDVWIGHNVTIMPGVTIGSGVIIGSCSVVTKNVPHYSIVAGNPGRIVRQRFDNETIAKLLEIQWWDWPEDKIFANIREKIVIKTRFSEIREVKIVHRSEHSIRRLNICTSSAH